MTELGRRDLLDLVGDELIEFSEVNDGGQTVVVRDDEDDVALFTLYGDGSALVDTGAPMSISADEFDAIVAARLALMGKDAARGDAGGEP